MTTVELLPLLGRIDNTSVSSRPSELVSAAAVDSLHLHGVSGHPVVSGHHIVSGHPLVSGHPIDVSLIPAAGSVWDG